jgi:hypothetical protein
LYPANKLTCTTFLGITWNFNLLFFTGNKKDTKTIFNAKQADIQWRKGLRSLQSGTSFKNGRISPLAQSPTLLNLGKTVAVEWQKAATGFIGLLEKIMLMLPPAPASQLGLKY